jgi:hypothetical protein
MPYTFGKLLLGVVIPDNIDMTEIYNTLIPKDQRHSNNARIVNTINSCEEELYYVGKIVSDKEISAIDFTDIQELIECTQFDEKVFLKQKIDVMENIQSLIADIEKIEDKSYYMELFLQFLDNERVTLKILWSVS